PLAVNSFPIQGYSLALDFPRTRTVLSLVPALDAIVWKYGGKIYLTKDAASGPKMGRINASTLREPKFWSYLKGRITL
ncbi:MAG: FAD-binding protein, partial [Bacteroidetes bacterium]|nr:FAD-binding protein [Bacteroidota bacterium]